MPDRLQIVKARVKHGGELAIQALQVGPTTSRTSSETRFARCYREVLAALIVLICYSGML